MMGRNYKVNLNQSQQNLNAATQTMNNWRKFQNISEDPGGASRAFQLRQEYSKQESYLRNAENAQGRLDTAESAVRDVLGLLDTVKARAITGANGVWTTEDRQIMAEEINAAKDAILQNMNLSYTGQYVLGGTLAGTPPLSVATDGRLLFQGMPLDSFGSSGVSYIGDPAMDALLDGQKVLVDFGFGIDPAYPESGFDVALSAAKFLGYGDDGTMSNNLYNLLGDMADKLEDPAFTPADFGPYLDKFNEAHKNYLTNLTEMGAKAQTVEYTLNRVKDNQLALVEKQNYVEFVDPAEAVTEWKWQEFAYQSALAIGTQILQPSLLDYLS
jgi:flagellar hook-associated protein 3 FlgL